MKYKNSKYDKYINPRYKIGDIIALHEIDEDGDDAWEQYVIIGARLCLGSWAYYIKDDGEIEEKDIVSKLN